jgi:glyceraldehyde-3-phosphate dehydrogenase type II
MKKNVFVIGTGTIGEPLIGLLADFKKKLGIDVYFHKRTPLIDEIAKVNSLIKRGAHLVVDPEKIEAFQSLGHEPVLNYEAALKLCDVVIDCTPAGNMAKELHYLSLAKKDKNKLFIAQGSEKGFGFPYAHGINDAALGRENPQFIQVVSCNTHNIACLLKTVSQNLKDIKDANFVCIRRANDISQNGSFIASPQVGVHSDKVFGTHHARDAYDLLATLYEHVNIRSSAMKLNTQYMHTICFDIAIKKYATRKDIISHLKADKFVATTHKTLANKVFSFGRDHGYYGRIYNQTVVSLPTVDVFRDSGATRVKGFCFTPQDGNSLLSSIAAAMYGIYGKKYKDYMKLFDDYLFQEI